MIFDLHRQHRPNSYRLVVYPNRLKATPGVGFNLQILQQFHQLGPLAQTTPSMVVHTNPANFLFASFAADASWAVNTQSAVDVEVACQLATRDTPRVTHVGVFVNVPATRVRGYRIPSTGC